jgi:hypothetical protein
VFAGLEQEKKRKREIFPYVFFLEELQWSPRRGRGRRSGRRTRRGHRRSGCRILFRSPRRGREPVRSGRGRAAAGPVRLVAAERPPILVVEGGVDPSRPRLCYGSRLSELIRSKMNTEGYDDLCVINLAKVKGSRASYI